MMTSVSRSLTLACAWPELVGAVALAFLGLFVLAVGAGRLIGGRRR